MRTLIIVESPTKSKTIQKYLGEGYEVLASAGHVADLPDKSLGINVDNNFEPMYEIKEDKKDVIKKLKAAVKKADEVFLATDPDREGEAISWHLANVLGLQSNKHRIEFNEISQNAVRKAMENPRDIAINLVNAQQARRVLDRLVGYKISPIISLKVKKGSSAGRVQSPALKMIVDREREIESFVPEEYWKIFAHLVQKNHGANKTIKAEFVDFDGKKMVVTNAALAERAVLDLDKAVYTVDSVKKAVSTSRPAPPFTTSTMQQDASSKLGLSSPQTMRLAQQLYEGVEVEGEGLTALVTYIRTDSVRVSADVQNSTISYVVERFGKEYAPKKPNFYATKKAAQDAHEAIRPINIQLTPDSVKEKIDRNQYRLYKLIYDRFLASQMTPATYDTLNIHINAIKPSNDKPFGFRLKGKTVKFKGFTAVYSLVDHSKTEDIDDDKNVVLPKIEEGDVLIYKENTSEQKFTKPAPRYTDATLVKALEENGIGRPSTYATIIGVLSKRSYTEKEGKAIKPTNLGLTIVDYMMQYFKEIVNLGFTANMEDKLDIIEEGKVEWQSILQDFYPNFCKQIISARKDGKKYKVEEEVTDVVCEKCAALMVIRDGRYGKFLACPNYPECKNIKSIIKQVSTCPMCAGMIYEKKSKGGKSFYGCSGYPNCNFMSWDLPAPIFCPECKDKMKIAGVKGKKKYLCLNKECKYEQDVVIDKVTGKETTVEEQSE